MSHAHQQPPVAPPFELPGALSAQKFEPESDCVNRLLAMRPYDIEAGDEISRTAAELVTRMRRNKKKRPLVDTFLKEYGLSNQEGVALMCLAESLLRVPDSHTADLLIADKLNSGDWAEHLGKADDLMVNVSTWGLILTGSLVSVEQAFTSNPTEWLKKLAGRLGEPVIRKAMQSAMFILGRAFVLGRDMEEALHRSAGGLYSFDMLGEAARDRATAERYFESYAEAIRAVGDSGDTAGSVSIKLSALHPRLEEIKRQDVLVSLRGKVLTLCELARQHNVSITIDAEEADRLQLTLDLFISLYRDPALAGWEGLGLVVQAYGKRALAVLEALVQLAACGEQRIPVRLVKGAYWDAEIKHAQQAGVNGFPVFTRKENTDLSYLACAAFMLKHTERLFPQFATHNAHTIAAIMHMAAGHQGFEFQRLHGMGNLVYGVAGELFEGFPNVRIYAPVGGYKDLLAYLVRRLLENGANSSFVNRFLDEQVSPEALCTDPIMQVAAHQDHAHAEIALPSALYLPSRENSRGYDLNDDQVLRHFESLCRNEQTPLQAFSLVGGKPIRGESVAVYNPADADHLVGHYDALPLAAVPAVFSQAGSAQMAWNGRGFTARAAVLNSIADEFEASDAALITLLIREAGKTLADAVAELREAVDFCRYYAAQAEAQFADAQVLPGPTGEKNTLTVAGRGVFVTISPWNFPLAIFTGQVVAALVMGNAVVAKPAEETALIAHEAVRLMHRAGVPGDVLHLALGGSELGKALVDHGLTAGVAFTGSTEAAWHINRALAARDTAIAPLIAETGGQNVMFVDSTALLEQVTDDVITSAFLSAGQRCSALRVLYLQDDIADEAMAMIKGAMAELAVGDPARRETDIGPIISAKAADQLRAHVKAMAGVGAPVHTAQASPGSAGHFLAPTLIEIEGIEVLSREHFGPILHVVRYRGEDLDEALESALSSGYGLTLGLHSRIERRWHEVAARAPVGNVYVNRDMVGAVVGTQPFGGQGLSGTGPKAGGPNYLLRFGVERTLTINTVATGGNAELLSLGNDA